MHTTPPPPTAHRPRIALYGHDTQGLGHLRRNLGLGGRFASEEPGGLGADTLLLTGASEVGLFTRPDGVEAIVLPGVAKDDRGRYAPRRMRGHLHQVVDLRRATLTTALTQFSPDLLVVDKAPWGFSDELADALPSLAQAGTRLVLGLRDVLDDPATTRREWAEQAGDEAVRCYYDEVWVYGDPCVHDVRGATGMAPDVAARTHHVGYLAADRVPPTERHERPPNGGRDYVLVMVGGGQDGASLARAAAEASVPADVDLVILAGPQLPESDLRILRRAARRRPQLHVQRFSRHGAAWLENAAAAVTMGGANTVAEILDGDTPALVVPRVAPRAEQLVRAQALAAHGALDMLHPQDLTPAALTDWIAAAIHSRVDRGGLRLDGFTTVVRRTRALLADGRTGMRRGPSAPRSSTSATSPGVGPRATSTPVLMRSHDVAS